jgi:hypothetical protein
MPFEPHPHSEPVLALLFVALVFTTIVLLAFKR